MSTARLARTQQLLRERDLDALLVGPGADLRYLVGYHALELERLTMLVVPASGTATLVVPRLETARAVAHGVDRYVELVDYDETTDPVSLVAAHLPAGVGGQFAVSDRLWAAFMLRLQQARTKATWQAASPVTGQLRMHKDANEVAALRAAAQAIDAVHAHVPTLLAPGRRERDVGRDLAELILDDHDAVNFVIVASGPNSASPHHETGERMLAPGDAVVVDIGGTRDGYCSDSTRNYVLGTPDPAYAEIHEVVAAANRAGIAAVTPGTTAEAVDEAARAVIRDSGFGAAFVHRTGHGIGVDEHEAPWIVAGDRTILAEGMAFSIEPGVYLADRFGVRIEDVVAVTAHGVDVLNEAGRELVVIDG